MKAKLFAQKSEPIRQSIDPLAQRQRGHVPA
jgi:hypothetical protein